jgi:hypothetical protein
MSTLVSNIKEPPRAPEAVELPVFVVYRELNKPGQPVAATHLVGPYRRDQVDEAIARDTGVTNPRTIIVNATTSEEACQQVRDFDLGRTSFNASRDKTNIAV